MSTRAHPQSRRQQTQAHGVRRTVSSALSSRGRPLEDETRRLMESRFQHDFSRVRVHTDGRAADSARALNAHAYTLGTDIAFASGRYSPQTSGGFTLLAHELAHCVQQQGGPAPSLAGTATHEREAEDVSSALAAGAPVCRVATRTGVGIARQGGPIDPEAEAAVEGLKEASPPGGDAPSGVRAQKALTPDELMEHVTPPRVHEEVGRLRQRLASIEARVASEPRNTALKAQAEAMRARLDEISGRGIEPGLGGRAIPGHGNVNTRAVIQVVDANGNLIALARGEWRVGMHAEEVAIARLRLHLRRLGIQRTGPGSKIIVAGNQVVCPGICRPALRQFAEELGADSVDALVRVRPSLRQPAAQAGTAPRPVPDVSPKTAERGSLRSNVPQSAYRFRCERLYEAATRGPAGGPGPGAPAQAVPPPRATMPRPQTSRSMKKVGPPGKLSVSAPALATTPRQAPSTPPSSMRPPAGAAAGRVSAGKIAGAGAGAFALVVQYMEFMSSYQQLAYAFARYRSDFFRRHGGKRRDYFFWSGNVTVYDPPTEAELGAWLDGRVHTWAAYEAFLSDAHTAGLQLVNNRYTFILGVNDKGAKVPHDVDDALVEFEGRLRGKQAGQFAALRRAGTREARFKSSVPAAERRVWELSASSLRQWERPLSGREALPATARFFVIGETSARRRAIFSARYFVVTGADDDTVAALRGETGLVRTDLVE